jgi:hypothetical protein
MNYNSSQVRNLLPKKLHLVTSNGEFELNQSDCVVAPPMIQISYHHFTPDKTGDVLSDGEPDYLGLDIQPIKIGDGYRCKVELTYGDAMMFSWDMIPSQNKCDVKVGHYNGYGSKFDSEYEFYFKENSINDLMEFFNKLLPELNLEREKLNFLDGDKNSFKMEKVRYISDFRGFSRLNRL